MLKEKVARAIRQLKKGKTEYFDEIYDLTRASVYYVIRGVLKDSYLVEDAMQETYVAFLNSIAKIDDEQNPLSYLLQIAKNKALDEARRMTRAAGANIDDVEIATATTPTERSCPTFWKSSRKNFLNKKIKNFSKTLEFFKGLSVY